jgi:X-Pro dipeptidyl-peptidase
LGPEGPRRTGWHNPYKAARPVGGVRAFAPFAALLSVAALLSGCVQAPADDGEPPAAVARVPAERYADAELRELDFAAKDGTTIKATAYLPTKPLPGHEQQQRFGTIVNFSPYYTNLYGIDTDGRLAAFRSGARAFNETAVGTLLAHGFAYVAASVPGTGGSGGCFEMGGLHEQTVMAEFIDWVGAQPWSNGNVGMAGGSYDGTTQWMAAIHAPKHLRTIVPHVSITDFYEYEYQDGAPYAWWGPFFTTHYYLLVGLGVNGFDFPPAASPQPDVLVEHMCPEARQHLVEGAATYAKGVYDGFWKERNYGEHMGRLNASVLLVHGLWDWNVKPLHLDVWDRIPTEKAFWLQQMAHNSPWRNTYKPEWVRPDWNSTLLAWYDHYLHGVENGIPDLLPGAWVQDHAGLWRTETRWPPADVAERRLRLGAGSLSEAAPPSGQTVFATPPSYAGAYIEPSVGLRGPSAPDEVVAKFLTEPLAQPMRISGVPSVHLNLSVDRPGNAHLVAQLWRVTPGGTWEFLDMGGRGLAQRNDRTRDEAVEPLQRMQVTVELNPTESWLGAGDRLALTLAGDDPDWFHPNGHTPTFFVEHGSTLALPLLPADAPRGVDSRAAAASNPFFLADPKQF